MPCLVHILLYCCWDLSGQSLFCALIAFCGVYCLSVFMMRNAHLRWLLFADLFRGVDCRFWFFFHSFGMV